MLEMGHVSRVLLDCGLSPLNRCRKARSAFPRLQIELQAVEKVDPSSARLFKRPIRLGKPLMRKAEPGPTLVRRESPSDTGSRPVRLGTEPVNPIDLFVLVQCC